MASYLLVSSPIGGHVAPVRAVGATLVANGHKVRMLTGSRFGPAIERDGMSFTPWPGSADYDDLDLNGFFPGRRGLSGSRAVRFDMSNLFVKAMPAQFRTVQAALDEEPADAILADLTAIGLLPLLVGTEIRPPVHVLGCTPLPVGSRDTFPYGLGLPPPVSWFGRLRARLMTAVAEKVVLGKVQREVDGLLSGLGLSSSPVLFIEWFTLAERFWQLTVPNFEYPRSDLPANVAFAGPILPEATGQLPEWWGDLDGTRPVVHVTQGTVDNHDLSMLVGPTIAGLADEDVLVVATTGGRPISDLPVALPGNARVAEFIPYHLLLEKVDVMVTNGGYGGVQFALANGVPLVVAGEREDKPDIAARVAGSGVGQNLGTGRPTPERVAAAILDVLGRASYRDAAERIAAQVRGTDALTTIVTALEEATSHPDQRRSTS
jgi:UDP:flavonoid glycosyltransferase YjiC (YdhE family)